MAGDIPQYSRVRDALKAEILDGRYASRRSFPSEVALARRFATGRSTIKRALLELHHLGLISARQGSGTFVTRQGASRKIGLIVPGVAVTDFFQPIMSEINRLAREDGWALLFAEVFSLNREKRLQQVRDLAADFIKKRVAGVIYEPLAGPNGVDANRHILAAFRRAKIPVVLIDCDIVAFPERSEYDVVGVNDVEAGAKIAAHLMSVGAKKIHFLICKLCPMTFVNRLAGAESQLKLAGAKMPKGGNVLYAEADDLKALKGYLRRQKSRPDAFICSNDAIAAIFKQTLERAGLRVPEDVMLTGFADLPIAALMTPPLTTVRQDREQMARTAFRRLMERIADPSLPPCDLFLLSSLVARGSTARQVK